MTAGHTKWRDLTKSLSVPSGKLYTQNNRTKMPVMHIKIRDHMLPSFVIQKYLSTGGTVCNNVFNIFHTAGSCFWCKLLIWVKVVVIGNFAVVLSPFSSRWSKLLLVVVRIKLMSIECTSPATQDQAKSNTSMYTEICRKLLRICVKRLKD